MRTWITRAGAAIAMAAAASAPAVPPPPMGTRDGPTAICATSYAVRLAAGEHAAQFMRDHWVVTGPGYQFGVRSDLRGLEGDKARVIVPGFPPGERQHVREYPGNNWWGWTYAFPLPDGVTLRISSSRFTGTAADRALLARVLIGAARNRLCIRGG